MIIVSKGRVKSQVKGGLRLGKVWFTYEVRTKRRGDPTPCGFHKLRYDFVVKAHNKKDATVIARTIVAKRGETVIGVEMTWESVNRMRKFMEGQPLTNYNNRHNKDT